MCVCAQTNARKCIDWCGCRPLGLAAPAIGRNQIYWPTHKSPWNPRQPIVCHVFRQRKCLQPIGDGLFAYDDMTYRGERNHPRFAFWTPCRNWSTILLISPECYATRGALEVAIVEVIFRVCVWWRRHRLAVWFPMKRTLANIARAISSSFYRHQPNMRYTSIWKEFHGIFGKSADSRMISNVLMATIEKPVDTTAVSSSNVYSRLYTARKQACLLQIMQ